MAAVRRANMGGGAGQPDHRAASAPQHVRHRGAGHDEAAIEGDGNNLPPFRQGHFQKRGLPAQARVGDQDIDAADGGEDAVHHAVHLAFVGNIRHRGQGLPTHGVDFPHHRIDDGAIRPAVDDDCGAIPRQGQGDGTANILARAGNEGDFA